MIKNLFIHLAKIDFKKHRLYVVALVAVVALIFVGASLLNKPTKNTAKKEMILTIPEMGGTPALHTAMKENSRLRQRVKQIVEIDEAALFSNYKTVDNVVTEIMLLWIGLTPAEMKKLGRQKSAEVFIRRYYGAPDDEPIKNNPMFGERPWYDLLQSTKAKILMQGNGHKIFDGVAYFDSNEDKMVVQGGLSLSYVEGLATFVQTQPKDKQRGFVNNYLFFIDNTLGLKNLNSEERAKLKQIGFLR